VQSWVLWVLKRAAVLLAMIAVTLTAVRIYDTQRAPPLELWHTYAPSEMDADEIDQADWDQYLAAEQAVFDDVRAEVTAQLDPAERVPFNGISRAARCIRATSRRTGTGPTCWSPTAPRPEPWCCCTG
jgi:hypothetical protein